MNVRSTSRTRLLAISLLVIAFVAGGLAGAAFSRGLEAGEPDRSGNAAPACEEPKERGRGSLLDQLDLTAEQRARIDTIMERRKAETKAFWDGEGQRMRAIVDSTRAEIRGVLTPTQRAEYDRLREEHRARRKAEHDASENGSGREASGPGSR